MPLPIIQPSRVTVMIKPVGALCNLDCTYCYYLPTKTIYPGHEHRMSLQTLEDLFAGMLPHFADEVTIAWQGGEPTLAGLPFFEKAIELQARYARPGQRVYHALQTNGTLLDNDWCAFFNRHQFLIGLSVDGPPRFHDHYRLTNRGQPSSPQVFRGMNLLQKHKVEFNILTVLNNINVHHPDVMLDYLLSLGTRFLQFIPAIEWVKSAENPNQNVLAPYSPDPIAYGQFLCRIFDVWFEKLRHRISVRDFDAVLNKLVLNQTPLCILDDSCHRQLTIEHDGAVFGCDHFVERRWQLAQIGDPGWSNAIHLDGSAPVGLTVHGTGYAKNADLPGHDIHTATDLADPPSSTSHIPHPTSHISSPDSSWLSRIDSPRLSTFAQRKQHLPEQCVKCQWKQFCHGGCPKHRSTGGEAAEPTILCAGYLAFFAHAMPRLEWLAGFFRQNQQPPPPSPTRKPPRVKQPSRAAGMTE